MLRVEKEVLEAGGRRLVQGENWKHVHAPLRITLASNSTTVESAMPRTRRDITQHHPTALSV